MKTKRGGGPAQFGKPSLTIDQAGFWPSLTDEEVELMAGKLRARLTEAQQKRADKELEVRAARKARQKPGAKKARAKAKKRRRKSPQRFRGEGEFNRYGKEVGEPGELTVKPRPGAGWHQAKTIGVSGHSHSYRTTIEHASGDESGEIVKKCRCGRTEQWLNGEWQLLDEGRK